MATTLFSPKQIAQALGVSESSVKRWVDTGRLPAAKTAGGHRKVSLPSVSDFVRKSGHKLVQPHLLGLAAAPPRATLERSQDPLYASLIDGREEECRALVLGLYQRGESVVELGDRLIGPVFRRVGDGWESGTIGVHQERRCCEVMMATLHELRRLLPTPPDDGPLAVTATPHGDFAEVPIRLVELTLVAAGWQVVPAGSGLPLAEIAAATVRVRPQRVCVSATHLPDPGGFVPAYRTELVEPTRGALEPGVLLHALGGNALAHAD
ncbi:MAG: B12-binding domain-containing protein, partial [Planctomycetota bacterium]